MIKISHSSPLISHCVSIAVVTKVTGCIIIATSSFIRHKPASSFLFPALHIYKSFIDLLRAYIRAAVPPPPPTAGGHLTLVIIMHKRDPAEHVDVWHLANVGDFPSGFFILCIFTCYATRRRLAKTTSSLISPHSHVCTQNAGLLRSNKTCCVRQSPRTNHHHVDT